MGRQEIDLGIDGKMTQFCRLATRLRRLPTALGNGLLQTKTNPFMPVRRQRAAVWLQHNKGVHCHAVAGGKNLRVVNAQITPVQFGADGGKQIGSVRAPDEDLRAPARGLWAQQDHRLRQIMLQQMPRVPGQLVWAVAHKVVGATTRPDLMQRLFINIIHPQQRQRLQLMMAHALAHVWRVLHTATQLFFGSEVQFAQQALLPAVPQGFVGGADIRHRQADQIAQAVFRLHLFGELLNDFRILNVTTLCGNRHQQVMTDQPGHQLRFA